MVGGITGVKPYLNDILIADRTKREYDRNLHAVLERIREFSLMSRKIPFRSLQDRVRE